MEYISTPRRWSNHSWFGRLLVAMAAAAVLLNLRSSPRSLVGRSAWSQSPRFDDPRTMESNPSRRREASTTDGSPSREGRIHPSYSKRDKCEQSNFFRAPPKLVANAKKRIPRGDGHPSPEGGAAAICVMQKGEDRYLEEWINYHLARGFDDIYVFDDVGSGNSSIHRSLGGYDHVHVLPVKKKFLPSHVHKQVAVYNACAKVIRGRQPSYNTTWVSFLDVDEFLVLRDHETVHDFLRDHCPEDECGAVGIPWLWFGTSNHTYYEARPVTQRFLHRDTRIDDTIKSIFRLKDFHCATNQHFVHLTTDPLVDGIHKPPLPYDLRGRVNWNGPTSPLAKERPNEIPAAVFHHYTKSLEEWYVRRCLRGDVLRHHGLKCTGDYPEPGTVLDASAASFFEARVAQALHDGSRGFIRRNSSESERPWMHHNFSEFGIQRTVPLRKLFANLRNWTTVTKSNTTEI